MTRLVAAGAGLALCSATALAADFPEPIPFSPAPIAFWQGSYVGAHAGGVWGDGTSTLNGFPPEFFIAPPIVPSTYGLGASGLMGGVQWGYNHQIGNLVVGVESDISVSDLRRTITDSGTTLGLPYDYSGSQSLDWLGTTRVRIGYTPMTPILLYATGGIAYGRVTVDSSLAFPALTYAGRESTNRVGWTAGAGVEWAFGGNWSAKLEYLYYDLGGSVLVGYPTPINPPFQTHQGFDLAGHILRVGINHKVDLLNGWSNGTPYAGMDGPSLASTVKIEAGTRYFFSTGRTKKDLYVADGSAMVSRLTYDNLAASSGETFARADHVSGFFVKGYGGIGKVGGGKLVDEDFPPFIAPYSSTDSDQRDGQLGYFTADIGYTLLATPRYKLGLFGGYSYYGETLNALGCAQTATSGICDPALPSSYRTITQEANWAAARVGVAGELRLGNRVTVSAEAAWLPYASMWGADTHWLRLYAPGGFNGPVREDGEGSGFQAEASVSYQVTNMFSLGIGGRYQRLETTEGFTHFESGIFGGVGVPQPVRFLHERYGGFVQGAFKF